MFWSCFDSVVKFNFPKSFGMILFKVMDLNKCLVVCLIILRAIR